MFWAHVLNKCYQQQLCSRGYGLRGPRLTITDELTGISTTLPLVIILFVFRLSGGCIVEIVVIDILFLRDDAPQPGYFSRPFFD